MVVDDVEEDGVRRVADGGLELGEARRCVEVDEVTDAHIGVRVSTLAPNACLACVAERRERRAPCELGRRTAGRPRPWDAVRLLAVAFVIGVAIVVSPVVFVVLHSRIIEFITWIQRRRIQSSA